MSGENESVLDMLARPAQLGFQQILNSENIANSQALNIIFPGASSLFTSAQFLQGNLLPNPFGLFLGNMSAPLPSIFGSGNISGIFGGKSSKGRS